MAYWLMKSEPDSFSIHDLVHSAEQTTRWDGVRNYQARNFLREMVLGDLAFFYHSNAKANTGIVGIVRVVKTAYPDPTAFDPQSDYFDAKSDAHHPRWFAVEVRLVERFERPLLLSELHLHANQLGDFKLLKKGNRLSVLPLSLAQWNYLNSLNSLSQK